MDRDLEDMGMEIYRVSGSKEQIPETAPKPLVAEVKIGENQISVRKRFEGFHWVGSPAEFIGWVESLEMMIQESREGHDRIILEGVQDHFDTKPLEIPERDAELVIEQFQKIAEKVKKQIVAENL